MTIDIYSGGKYPANALSNFMEHSFIFRGFSINSMEGLIAGLTYKDPIEQMRIFLLSGIKIYLMKHIMLYIQMQILERH